MPKTLEERIKSVILDEIDLDNLIEEAVKESISDTEIENEADKFLQEKLEEINIEEKVKENISVDDVAKSAYNAIQDIVTPEKIEALVSLHVNYIIDHEKNGLITKLIVDKVSRSELFRKMIANVVKEEFDKLWE